MQYFCSPPLTSVIPLFPPVTPSPHPQSTPLSCMSDSHYDGADLHTAGLSLTRTHAPACTHKHTHYCQSVLNTLLNCFILCVCFLIVFCVVHLTRLASSRCRSLGSVSPMSTLFFQHLSRVLHQKMFCFSSRARVWTTTDKHMFLLCF